jgi:molybdopterin-synthase adenylyltransferase
MTPIIYLFEDQIQIFCDLNLFKNKIKYGTAYSKDHHSVFQAFFPTPDITPSGIEVPCLFNQIASINDFHNIESNLDEWVSKNYQTQIAIFFSLDNGSLEHKAFIMKEDLIYNGEIKFIPRKSDLFSRSKGLLEIDYLSQKTVGIVGLGSGGSPIAVELAKAGIGKFVLIDFDRLELSNIARHVCGINDLGRLKTLAVKDLILQKNPYANVETLEIDVNNYREQCINALANVDLILCASDNDQSRFLLNEISLKYKITSIFGRAITRAVGGDILRVRPHMGPCYSCLYSQNIRQEGGDDEELSQKRQAKKLLPDYTSDQEINVAIQVGLSSDIAPISNLMVKLSLVELSKEINSGIKNLEEDLISDFYIWANRRENAYESWDKLEFNFNKPTILRWYGAKVSKDPNCMVCGI